MSALLRRLRPAALLVLLLFALPLRADDPVEALRVAYQNAPDQNDPVAVKKYGELLLARVDAVRSVGDLRRALLLQEWRSESRDLALIVEMAQERLGGAFQKAVRDIAASADPPSRAAVAILLGRTAAEARAGGEDRSRLLHLIQQETSGTLRELAGAKESSVRAAVAIAVGQIGGREAVKTLTPLLERREEAAIRRVASASLASALRIADEEERKGHQVRPQATAKQVLLEMFREIGPVATAHAGDADPAVRRLCLGVAEEMASALAERVRFPIGPVRAENRAELVIEYEELTSFLAPLARLSAAVARQTGDSDSEALVQAVRSLERLAEVRLRVRRFAEPIPGTDDDPLSEPLRAAMPGLRQNLTHKEVRVRVGSINVLEVMAGDAASAAGDLVKALKDENVYVRWAAVRAFGKMAPKGAEGVPGLAARLEDESGDVRSTAALVLVRYGPAAKDAVPALTKAVRGDEAEMQLLAANALAAVGSDAKPASAALIVCLTNANSQVRRAAAAALGKVSPSDANVRAALLKALADSDEEVREAASTALLSGPGR